MANQKSDAAKLSADEVKAKVEEERLANEAKAKVEDEAKAKLKAEAEAKAEEARVASEAKAKAEEEAKAKAEGERLANEAKAKVEATAALGPGPVARQEIRFRKKTYAPGENLPGDIEDDVVSSLERLGAI